MSSPFRYFPVQRDPSREEQLHKPNGQACPMRIWYEDWFAARRTGGVGHGAQDIFAPAGAKAIAMADGIAHTGSGDHAGLFVELRDPAYGRLYMAHLKSIAVRDGARVRAGDVIGQVGNTGNAFDNCPHLHIAWTDSSGQKKNLYETLRALEAGAPPPSDAPLGHPRARIWLIAGGTTLGTLALAALAWRFWR